VRRLLLVALVAVVAGCGTAAEQTNVPASSSPAEAPTVETGGGTVNTKPPLIVLVSPAGKQEAVLGSYCLTGVDPDTGAGTGVCRDSGPVHPEEVTAVKPGDSVSIVLSDARVGKEGSFVVRPLGCEKEVIETVQLAPGEQSTVWQVDLAAGAYQLDVFTLFESHDGRSGDVSGSLGLLVANDAPVAIEPGPPRRSGC
jgi:hypothetical protein